MRPTRALITAPTANVISLAEAKLALGIVGTDQDGMLTAALAAAVSQLDPASGGWLGRALRPQTWELRLSGFADHKCTHPTYSRDAIALPFPKLISITSLKYDDAAGVEQTLSLNTDFRVLGAGTMSKQAIAPLPDKSWPTARCAPESVRIRYQCGYQPAVGATPGPAAPDELPAAIVHGIVLMARMILSNASNLYVVADKVEGVGEMRFAVTSDANALVKSVAEGLLFTNRVFG